MSEELFIALSMVPGLYQAFNKWRLRLGFHVGLAEAASCKLQTMLAAVQSRGGGSSHASTPTVTLSGGGIVPAGLRQV